jgi:hypothetical protein
MEKEFVNYNQALKLKALGFNEPGLAYYQKSAVIGDDTILPIQIMDMASNFNDGEYSKLDVPFWSAPTFSQAFRWFREKGYDVKVLKESPGLYFGFYWNGAAWIMVGNGTYEASELACLDKLIEVVEQIEKVEHGVYR